MSRLAYSDVQEGCQLDDSDDEAVGDSLVLSTNDPPRVYYLCYRITMHLSSLYAENLPWLAIRPGNRQSFARYSYGDPVVPLPVQSFSACLVTLIRVSESGSRGKLAIPLLYSRYVSCK